MLLKFKKSIKGQDRDKEGMPVPVKFYLENKVYEIGPDLAAIFLKMKVAEKTSDLESPEEKPEEKKEKEETFDSPSEAREHAKKKSKK